MDFVSMQDSEIRQALIGRGANVGPVTPSTRNLYIKKLQQLMAQNDSAGGDAATVPRRVESEVDEVSDKFDHQRNSLYPVLDKTSLNRKRSPVPNLDFEDEEPVSDGSSGDEAEESARFLTPEEIEAEHRLHTSMRASKHPSTSEGYGYIIKGLLLVALLVFLFFVAERTFDRSSKGTEEL